MTKVLRCLAVLMTVASLTGCTGLQQFPDTSKEYTTDLGNLDPDYAKALKTIYAGTLTFKQVRNQLIDTRLAVIDEHYEIFEAGLTKDDVRAELGVALVGIGVGGVGSFVSKTASQILSAVSGGLAGASSAYGKAVLYDNTLKALIAQMQAGRAVIRARIFEKWDLETNAYPLWLARQDLEAYQFAGSLPGAIQATSADAKEKQDKADVAIIVLQRKAALANEPARLRVSALLDKIDALSDTGAIAMATNPPIVGNEAINAALLGSDPQNLRLTDASSAKLMLEMMVSLTPLDDLAKWEAVLR